MNFNLRLFLINSIVEKIYVFSCFMLVFLEVFTVLFYGFSPFSLLLNFPNGSFSCTFAYKKVKKQKKFKIQSFGGKKKAKAKRAELKSFMWICIYHNMLDFLSYTFYKPGSLLWQVFKFFPRLKVQQKVHFGLISNFFQRQNFEFLSYKKFQ